MGTVYRKSPKGVIEIETRAHRLTPRVRSVLIMVDGRRGDDELRAVIPQQVDESLQFLLDNGFIEVAGAVESPPQGGTRPATAESGLRASTTPAAAPAKAITPATNETVSKLWPSDTRKIFMPRCTSLKAQFIEPCSCVITKLMTAMTHDEFLKKSGDGTIEKDQRLIQIRRDCATAPKRKG